MNRRDLLKYLATALGTSCSGIAARAVLAGASAVDATGQHTLGAAQLVTVGQLCERIIPTTETPGALQAGVADFIQVIYSRWYRQGEREQFRQGLAALESMAEEQHLRTIAGCTPEQQVQLLTAAERLGAESGAIAGRFFNTLKELTVFGYYTSELGAKQELIFNPVPMRYKGDYLFADVGRQWTPRL